MVTPFIYYKKGFKYQSTRSRGIYTKIEGLLIETDYCTLDMNGILTVYPKYCWDGASRFPDTKWIMRGAFFHDVLYQLIREEVLDREYKEAADKLLERCCIEDRGIIPEWAMKIIARCVYQAVKYAGRAAAHPNRKRRELVAP